MNMAARHSGKLWKEISILVTNDDGIRELKQAVFGKSEITDVISCCYDPIPGECDGCSGEIIVNVQRAAQGTRPTGINHEFALYIAHGCNHLTGETDNNARERKRMRNRELRWLREAEAFHLLNNLILPEKRPVIWQKKKAIRDTKPA